MDCFKLNTQAYYTARYIWGRRNHVSMVLISDHSTIQNMVVRVRTLHHNAFPKLKSHTIVTPTLPWYIARLHPRSNTVLVFLGFFLVFFWRVGGGGVATTWDAICNLPYDLACMIGYVKTERWPMSELQIYIRSCELSVIGLNILKRQRLSFQ